MKNLSAIIFAIAITTFINIAGSTNVLADSCRNVSFTVKNDRNGNIEIKKVTYFNQNENRWRDEDVPNTEIARGQSKKFGKEDLQDAEGDNITKIKFEFVDKNDGQRKVSAVFVPGTPKCSAERNYGTYSITGSSTVQESDGFLSGDSCKNVIFNYINGRNGEIKVKSVKYFNRNSGNWKTEDVANEVTAQGAKGDTNRDDLGDADGDDITKVIFIYEFKSNQRGANWSDPIESKTFEPTDPRCHEGKIYGNGQKWTIGEETVPNNDNSSSSGSSGVRPSGQINPNVINGNITPTGQVSISLKTPKAEKSASLIYFNFGENSEYTQFFQDTVKLKKAMEGYQRVVLLKSQETPSWLDLSEADEKNADAMMSATKDNFFNQIKDLTEKGYFIDIYIFAHGWNDQFGPKNNNAQIITSSDITSRLSQFATGYKTIPIRTVWGTTCYGSTLAEEWQNVGAKTVAGAKYVSFYPNAFGNFINDWNKGNVSFNTAVSNSDTTFVRSTVQTYIGYVLAPSRNKDWGNCPFGKTVLGDDPCAKDFFVTIYLAKDEWQNGKSGKDNMNNSSTMIITGDKTLTKNSKPKW